MPRVPEKRPKTFAEFIQIIETMQNKTKNPLWYRGCGNNSYKLIPSLYRHYKIKELDKLTELEYKLLKWFRLRSIPFHNMSLKDDWESLFFMQHYRVPTRLLDWTENPFIAFFFAVMNAGFHREQNKTIFNNPAAIWVLNPIAWNRHALRYESFDQGVLSTSDEQLKGYIPIEQFSTMNKFPVSLYGAHNSPRIVAQRGVFVIFGECMSPMEEIYKLENFPTNCLLKITLNKTVLPKMRKTILNHGITESVVFPDLEGLSKEIRRLFNFEV